MVQSEQRGTGHAVQVALDQLADLTGEVVVTYGDVPMLTSDTLADLVAEHRRQGAAVTVLTARVEDPTGYGRIMRTDDGGVAGIVEHKDADDAQRLITEINSGIYVFAAETLRQGLTEITPDNVQGELYLTDVVGVASRSGQRVSAYEVADLWQTEGVNDRVQLARMNAEMNRRILLRWMRAGVTIVDPASTWVHASVDLGEDVTLLPGTSLEGATSVGAGATIGPDTTLVDVEVGPGATVVRTHGSLSVIGADATVGPYAYLRPGTTLGERGKIGTFVETKNAQLGAGAKAPHLAYVGDAVIADGANIGAGVIFANYDGQHKYSTHGRRLQLRGQRLGAGRPGGDRRRRVRRGRLDHHLRRRRRGAGREPRPPAQHPRLGGAKTPRHPQPPGRRPPRWTTGRSARPPARSSRRSRPRCRNRW